jgi:hypothetical protein
VAHSDELEFALSGNRVTSSGKVRLEAFSGNIAVERIGMRRALSPDPIFRASAEAAGLHLEELSRAFEFGLVTGRVNGFVKDLEIAYGLPIHFEAELRSVPDPRVERRMSVTAIENLTTLTGGGSPFTGLTGLALRIFNDFPYRKIGIRCTLKNDFLRLNGLIHEDGTEYLVQSGLTGIDIVQRTPANRIAWGDMLKRLERIGRTGETK